jgi:hypothetical protein
MSVLCRSLVRQPARLFRKTDRRNRQPGRPSLRIGRRLRKLAPYRPSVQRLPLGRRTGPYHLRFNRNVRSQDHRWRIGPHRRHPPLALPLRRPDLLNRGQSARPNGRNPGLRPNAPKKSAIDNRRARTRATLPWPALPRQIASAARKNRFNSGDRRLYSGGNRQIRYRLVPFLLVLSLTAG